MGCVAVQTDDLVFGRMLELELSGAGHSVIFERDRACSAAVQSDMGDERRVRRVRGQDSDVLGDAVDVDVLVADADCDIDVGRFNALGVIWVTVDSDRAAELGDSVRVLLRPFETSVVLRIVGELMAVTSDKTADTGSGLPSELLSIDSENSRASFKDVRLDLTRREYELLACLYASRGVPVSRSELIRRVWRYDFEGNTNVVDVYIRYLREKIDIPFGVKLIETVRGAGYRMV